MPNDRAHMGFMSAETAERLSDTARLMPKFAPEEIEEEVADIVETKGHSVAYLLTGGPNEERLYHKFREELMNALDHKPESLMFLGGIVVDMLLDSMREEAEDRLCKRQDEAVEDYYQERDD